MDLTFQVPMQYCSLPHQTLLLSPVPSTTGCCCCFGSISSFFSSSILDTYQPGEFIFQCPIILPFHTVHGVFKARMLKWFGIPFSSGPGFARLSTTIHLYWVTLHSTAHSFTELDMVVIHVISLVSFCDCAFPSVCPLMGEDKRFVEAS